MDYKNCLGHVYTLLLDHEEADATVDLVVAESSVLVPREIPQASKLALRIEGHSGSSVCSVNNL